MLCTQQSAFSGVRYRCYRSSLAGSVVAGIQQALLRKTLRHTVRHLVIVVLSEFQRKWVLGIVPHAVVKVRANEVTSVVKARLGFKNRSGFVFVGRLSEEKGIEFLVHAWEHMPYKLRVFGDGPMLGWARENASANVEIMGPQPREAVMWALASAVALVVPSIWYEGYPMVVAEAKAMGTPVIASDIGALAEIVRELDQGYTYGLGNTDEFAECVELATKRAEVSGWS